MQESENGQLKITYYSEIDVADIKEFFSSTETLAVTYTSYPEQENPVDFPSEGNSNTTYQLNISEIQKSPDAELDLEGYIVEFKPLSDRYVLPDIFLSTIRGTIQEQNQAEKTAFLVYQKSALIIDNASHNIPEVRAGPLTEGDS